MAALQNQQIREADAVVPAAPSVERALGQILECASRLPAESVMLLEAEGRVLAGNVIATADLWPFARAAMDGYAVRAADVASAAPGNPVRLAIVGAGLAGSPARAHVTPETAVRIATGAQVPDAADAVIPFEQIEVEGETLVVTGPILAGKHIFPAGEDARSGEVVLTAGTVLRSGHVGLLAGLGVERVSVVRRARVAILTVGDELVEPGQATRPGQVRDSNSYALAAAVRETGGIPWRLGIARDGIHEVAEKVREGVTADVLIVCAGMSVGERDVVKQALHEASIELLFWRVPMKPGAPAAFGLAGSTPVFGLPGTPGAAMVAFEELVRPALRAMMGYAHIHRPVLTATLSEPLHVKPGRRRYCWARVSVGDGGLAVRALRGQGTATLRSISDANALLIIDPETSLLQRGDRVAVQLLDDPDGAADGVHPIPMLAVVGAKGAGKTSLIERLLPELQRRGYRVGVIKHDAHGFEIDHPGTDTQRFSAAGADLSAIAGPDKAAFVYHPRRELSLDEVQALVRGVDLVLVEGYSQEPVPKIEVRRRGVASDKPALAGPIFAIVSDDDGEPAAVRWDDLSELADRLEREILTGRVFRPVGGGER